MKYLIFTMSETSDEMISMIAVHQSCALRGRLNHLILQPLVLFANDQFILQVMKGRGSRLVVSHF